MAKNADEKREDVHSSKEQSYITAHEKRPSTGRLISKALPPAPFTASLNPRAWHEFRHSEPNFSLSPSLPLSFCLSFYLTTLCTISDLRLRGTTTKSAVVCNLLYDTTSDPLTYRIARVKRVHPDTAKSRASFVIYNYKNMIKSFDNV